MIETDKIYNDDCLKVMASMPDDSVDAIVTDPPYGLNFMGVAWDTFDGRENGGRSDATFDKVGGNHHPVNAADQARTRKAENERFQSSMLPIFAEAFRVAKPGAHLLAFGGTRTYHRLACAIEDAGWEIRDCIMWVYGSGVPKGIDVSKAIDIVGGVDPRRSAVALASARERAGMSRAELASRIGCTEGSIRDWEEGRARTRGGAKEYVTPSIEYRNKLNGILGFTKDERVVLGIDGAGDRRGDGTVYGLGFTGKTYSNDAHTELAKEWSGWRTALKPAVEPIVVARKTLDGTVASNVLKYGTGAMNIDGCRVPTDGERVTVHDAPKGTFAGGEQGRGSSRNDNGSIVYKEVTGRFPANLIHDGSDEVLALFPNTGKSQGGERHTKGVGDNRQGNAYGCYSSGEGTDEIGFGDSASRFFKCCRDGEPSSARRYTDNGGTNFAMKPGMRRPAEDTPSRFFYCAKASRQEKNLGCESLPEGNFHVTVKPVELMRYLVRLVCRKGGLVLDPFAGSGTTCIACKMEGMDFIGCELNPQYAEIAEKRISAWSAEPENADDAPEQAEEPRSPTETVYNVDEL